MSASCAAAQKLPVRPTSTGRSGTPAPIRASSAIRSGGVSPSPGKPISQRSGSPAGRKMPCHLGVGRGVDAVAVGADDLPERRADRRGGAGEDLLVAAHGDAERAADAAVGAVGGDEPVRADALLGARGDVAQRGGDAVRVGVEAGERGAHPHLGRLERREVAEQHRLEVVLRDALGRARAERRRSARGSGSRPGAARRRRPPRACGTRAGASRPRRRRRGSRSSRPKERRSSIVRTERTVARGRSEGAWRCSTSRQRTPWRASWTAAASPAGPAPAIRTGT